MPIHNDSDPERIAKSAAMAQAFTPEIYARILSLLPTPASYSELHHRFQGNYPSAVRGDDPELLKSFDADRKEINTKIALIQGFAKVATFVDPTIPESLGVAPSPERTASTPVPLVRPRDFKVVYDPEGRLIASVTRVVGAKGYQIWACDGDPSVDADWRMVASDSNCKGIVVSRVNRAKYTVLRARAMRGHDAGPWSNLVSLKPLT